MRRKTHVTEKNLRDDLAQVHHILSNFLNENTKVRKEEIIDPLVNEQNIKSTVINRKDLFDSLQRLIGQTRFALNV